ncbi:hypothetical protein PF005_g23770 [Phytophthora fragariae]|uniref:Uncharacterized protein n=1 Tax=Phytophthora fragariae TaxID=53985 RepID=A0A6A4BNX9_9STRA|nr:hypothetical protein PF003_g24359 [Phytophthora fragariae]KAE8941393.1 hypothetical protein PF009_g8810 [Phytophthora fragariae]KAE8974736.1 hypothetical protein PF011_g24750 [Phytophthora fragariae]KAE9077739.1 hypothetical protein PF010_g23396 [Phytophthora fragariae]KAE9093173.1 hypothetical protein PF006_g24502 [Phytophthora fragariae]
MSSCSSAFNGWGQAIAVMAAGALCTPPTKRRKGCSEPEGTFPAAQIRSASGETSSQRAVA